MESWHRVHFLLQKHFLLIFQWSAVISVQVGGVCRKCFGRSKLQFDWERQWTSLGSIPVSAAVKGAVPLCCHPDSSKPQGAGNTPLSHYWADSRVIGLAGVFTSLPSLRCCWGQADLLAGCVVPAHLSHGSMCWAMSNQQQMHGLCPDSFQSKCWKCRS